MCMYIGIEDLAANALIRLLSQSKGNDNTSPFVRFDTLFEYGMAVIEKFTERQRGLSPRNELTAILIYNRESNSRLFKDYSAFFVRARDEEGYEGIRLEKNVGIKDLVRQFLGQIPVVIQDVFDDEEVLKTLDRLFQTQGRVA